MHNKELVKICKMTKRYSGERNVLHEIDFTLKKGQIVTIRGNSGSGKSTFLNIVGLLDGFNSGEYYFDGIKILKNRFYKYDKLRGSSIGFIFQNYNLIESLSVKDNILIPYLYNKTRLSKEREKKIDELCEEFDIYNLKNKRASYLSGGEKQRVAIVRALAIAPKLIIADEPTGNLDEANAKIINSKFKKLSGLGTSIIVVTHSNQIFNQVDCEYRLIDGKLMIDEK